MNDTVKPCLPEFIEGEAGKIEYDFIAVPDSHASRNLIAVVCHPHPLHGGTKDNKVVHTLCRALRDMGVASIRFNFRGVGKSEGQFDHGKGEYEDLITVVKFLRTYVDEKKPLLIAGFSFGSFIASRFAISNKVSACIMVAPPVSYPEFKEMNTFLSPLLVIQGDQDEVVDYGDVKSWVGALVRSPEFEIVEGAGHFFHGRLPELKSIVQSFVTRITGE